MSFALDVNTAPTWEPVSRTEAKLFARIDTDADDDLVDALIEAARERAEVECQRTIPQTTRVLYTAHFPASLQGFRLPLPPLVSVSSVKYYDGNNELQTVTSSNYIVRAGDNEGLVVPVEGYTWPSDVYTRPDAVQVTYVCGYAAAASVPEAIKAWIKVLVATMYDNRSEQTVGTIATQNKFVDRILDPYRLMAL